MWQIIKKMGAVTVLYFKWMGSQFKKLWNIITGRSYKNKPIVAQIEAPEVAEKEETETKNKVKNESI